MQGFTNALRGISGDYELNRLVGFFGGMVYVIGPADGGILDGGEPAALIGGHAFQISADRLAKQEFGDLRHRGRARRDLGRGELQ